MKVSGEYINRKLKFFHFMDATDSFDAIKLRDDQCIYTAFQIPRKDGKGHEFIGNTRVPQGSLNSSGTLIKVYRELFGDLDGYLKWYCDDAIASSTSQEDLLDKTITILQRFSEVGLRLSPEKCRWFVTEGSFCNIAVKAGTTSITKHYADKIMAFREPDSTSSLQTFLGLVCFVQKYVQNYAKHVSILTGCLHSEKTENGWKWGKPEKEAFEKLRSAVQNPTVLHNIQYVPSTLHIF